jgi:uncharacterized membrane protein
MTVSLRIRIITVSLSLWLQEELQIAINKPITKLYQKWMKRKIHQIKNNLKPKWIPIRMPNTKRKDLKKDFLTVVQSCE